MISPKPTKKALHMRRSWLYALAALAASLQTLAAASPTYVPGISYGKEEGLKNICAIAIGRNDTLLVAADGKVVDTEIIKH